MNRLTRYEERRIANIPRLPELPLTSSSRPSNGAKVTWL
jgi:hypothetical protein